MMRMLSIDSSTTSTGIAIFENGSLISSHTLIPDKNNKQSNYEQMIYLLIEFFKENKPDIVAIETPVVVRNPKTQRELTMIYGVVCGWCLSIGAEFCPMRPTEWRKWCGVHFKGKRKELKQCAVNGVVQMYPDLNLSSEDEAEAILIGHGYINWFNAHAVCEEGV